MSGCMLKSGFMISIMFVNLMVRNKLCLSVGCLFNNKIVKI